MILKPLRVAVLVFILVGGFWRYLLGKSYLGFLKTYNSIRLLVAVSEIFVLFTPNLAGITTWMMVMWLDLAFTHTPKTAKSFLLVWIVAICNIWLSWFFDRSIGRVISWFFIALVFVFFNAFWPLFAPKKFYRFGKRPTSAIFFCPTFTALALCGAIFIEMQKSAEWTLFSLLASVFLYEWFYTWRFAAKSLQRAIRKEFDSRFNFNNNVSWEE